MSEQEHKDFDERLAELNTWQIEQQKKLRAFQETQKKLLDLEHQNLLNGFETFNFNQRHNRYNESVSINGPETEENRNSANLQNFKNKDRNGIFNLKFPLIRLTEPNTSLLNVQNNSSSLSKSDNFYNEIVVSPEEKEMNKPKKFLKRGEGLARFRMTLNDFKGPPKIYKEKKIKTYLNTRPEFKVISKNVKSSKSNVQQNRTSAPKASAKAAPLPVKIYMPESKTKPCNSERSTESKQLVLNDRKPKQCMKSSIESLSLKPHLIATEWYNAMKAKEKAASRSENFDVKSNSLCESDIENKKDEKELRIFEILEKKVDDTSFCSTSSFVDKLMEHSLSSTPSKCFTKDQEMSVQGLKSLQSKFLDEEQVKRCEELNEISFEEVMSDESESENSTLDKNSLKEMPIIENSKVNQVCDERNMVQVPENEAEASKEAEKEVTQTNKVNRTLLQEYIKDFKKFKFMLEEKSSTKEQEEEEEEEQKEKISPKQLLKDERQQPNQHEIALKLQRKGLQDNVKQLLNWECPPRKRQPKRVVKKIKSRPKLEKSKAVSKEQNEKMVFSSSLLHERLNELEKEIEIFRKENKILERLQKECSEERTKLAKERRELQKQIQEEREQLEGKVAEEQKKLQKEKVVFEKYCKQVKNQPTRQEREETTKLKKEIEKLTETLTTKESRWGASQARLRNQIKMLEKENGQLKAEVEKYKKLSTKKVSFENDRNLNTKIIHAINSELGKLKPTVIRNSSDRNYQSLSARFDREMGEKPLRRIKSAPNVKKQMETCAEACSEMDEKALGSVSTDSGIETNVFRSVSQQKALCNSKITKEPTAEEPERRRNKSPVLGFFNEDPNERKLETPVESPVCDAIFGDTGMDATSLKIAEVKSRLERLSLLGCGEEGLQKHQEKMIRLQNDFEANESDKENLSLSEEEEEEQEVESEKKIDIKKQNGGRGLDADQTLRKNTLSKNDSFSSSYFRRNLLDTKLGENGLWEKFYEDGSKEINYPNGNVKKIFPGNKIVRMTYYNGDIKETDVAQGSEKYYYAETKTWHTTYKDGLEVLEFPNGQTERRHADGSTEISFPNGCIRYCDSSGRDEWRFLDGTVIKTNQCGHKILLMPNGQKEIHTKEFKRREYPDGTIKILYSDGTQETRYSSGRVRLKDKHGNLVMDSGGIR